ncbi:MAG: 23S rRNA (guanosine2251-2'-O)-methyltransferase [Rhodothermales bacterium]
MRKLDTFEIPRVPESRIGDARRHPIRIVVENVRSAFNVGSILRTADALRVEHVHLVGFSPQGDHKGVNKAALGAQDSVPWSHEPEIGRTLESLRRQGFTLAAVEITDSPRDPRCLEPGDFPLALVVGNEVSGVSDEALAACDFALELPQFGVKHSLNVAVAMGVVGYDATRCWKELQEAESNE